MTLTSRLLVALLAVAVLSGCSGLNRMQQRALSGGAIGAVGSPNGQTWAE